MTTHVDTKTEDILKYAAQWFVDHSYESALHGFLNLEIVRSLGDDFETITQWDIDHFERSIDLGERCGYCFERIGIDGPCCGDAA